VAGNDLNNAGTDNDSQTWATRVHWNPLDTADATVHLGAWAFHEKIPAGASGVVRSSAIAGHFNDLVRITPGTLLGAERSTAYGAELAGFFGPAWATGEWGTRSLRGPMPAGAMIATTKRGRSRPAGSWRARCRPTRARPARGAR
jgi:phosphate-selective porin OprO/OprP